jgi:tRNA(Ile)-lysidine synthase
VVRPLLEVSRDETDEYCVSHQLQPRLDATNLSLIPMRNRIRLELLPLLKSFNPQVVEALLRTARIADDDIAFLEKEASRLWKRLASKQDETIILNRQPFLKLSPSLQRYLLRLSIEALLGTLRDIEVRHIEEIMEALPKPAGKRLNLPYGLVFATGYDRYILGKNPTALSPFSVLNGEYALKIPGETVTLGWHIQASIITRDQMKPEADGFTAYLDCAIAGENLIVRPRRRGDRFQPLGMKEMKKIGEFMIDTRIPRDWRPGIPIVSSREQIMWVVGYRIDERAKVTGNTRKILSIKFKRS